MRQSIRNWSLTRERMGMALAILAVACLSSVIVQWSTHFPVEETVLEQSLFGDLVEETKLTASEQLPLRQTSVLPELRPLPEPANGQEPSESVALSETEAAKKSETTQTLLVPSARFTEPVDVESLPVQTVSYSEEEEAGWLSGVIEVDDPRETGYTQSSSSQSNVVQLGTIIPEE